MSFHIETAGERLKIDAAPGWVGRLIEGSIVGAGPVSAEPPTMIVRVESRTEAFDVAGWEPLTRGAWTREGEVVVRDVCASGFDVRFVCTDGLPEFVFRWRPALPGRVLHLLLRDRFVLLARAVLLHYPALWWAGTRGRVPLHAACCTAGDCSPLLAGPSGVGKSTLIAQELDSGGWATSDNVCVSDGATVWGLAEPMRLEHGSGRRTSHGRREAPMPGRVARLTPDTLVVVRRGAAAEPDVLACPSARAARSLVTGTLMAGELRRYWPFAATLSAGSGFGPDQSPIDEVALKLARRLPCREVLLARRPGVRLARILSSPLEVTA